MLADGGTPLVVFNMGFLLIVLGVVGGLLCGAFAFSRRPVPRRLAWLTGAVVAVGLIIMGFAFALEA